MPSTLTQLARRCRPCLRQLRRRLQIHLHPHLGIRHSLGPFILVLGDPARLWAPALALNLLRIAQNTMY